MATNTSIEWTHRAGTIAATWNPTTGCDKISAGCDNCYALTMAKRLKGMGSAKYQNDGHPVTSGPGFALTVHPDTLTEPLRWRDPRTVFVNSMSDLFHARVPVDFLAQVFAVMGATPRHTYQILTKRPKRMAQILGRTAGDDLLGESFLDEVLRQQISGRIIFDGRVGDPVFDRRHAAGRRAGTDTYDRRAIPAWPLSGVWLGTSIESHEHVDRANWLRETPAAVRFISAEPLLGPLPSLDLAGIDWLILGGESGHGSRPLDLGWFRELIGMARAAGTAVFVKQLGSVWAGKGKGGDWDMWPEDLRIREYPTAPVAVTS